VPPSCSTDCSRTRLAGARSVTVAPIDRLWCCYDGGGRGGSAIYCDPMGLRDAVWLAGATAAAGVDGNPSGLQLPLVTTHAAAMCTVMQCTVNSRTCPGPVPSTVATMHVDLHCRSLQASPVESSGHSSASAPRQHVVAPSPTPDPLPCSPCICICLKVIFPGQTCQHMQTIRPSLVSQARAYGVLATGAASLGHQLQHAGQDWLL
jgi:hypothetical protein